ncbi:hypothetical protein Aperf_G00000032854 [Anoplocephala perfoliata]
MSEGGHFLFLARLIPRLIPGCNVQEQNRAKTIYRLLQEMQKNSSMSGSYDVFIGPPLVGDCDLVNQWITLGEPRESLMQQLYQISFTCQPMSPVFVRQVANSAYFYLYPPIAAASVVVHGRLCGQGLVAYLLRAGWKRIALLYEIGFNRNEISKWMETFPLILGVLRGHQVFETVKIASLRSGMNVTKLFDSIQNNLDAVVLIARPSLAIQFLLGVQNFSKILEGRVAILHTNPTDLYTYDSLHAWKSLLADNNPILASGLSLIIQTALPKGTVYEKESLLYSENISLSIAHAAALAMQLAHLNIEASTGNVNPELGLFTPLDELSRLSVPTMPNITFHYNIQKGFGLHGVYDLYYFTIKPNATKASFSEISASKYGDVFELVGIIRHPLILPQKRGNISWPGDGNGPYYTKCLIDTCGFESMQVSVEISVFGFVCAITIYLCSVFISSSVQCKSRQINMQKLIFLEADLEFKNNDEAQLITKENSGEPMYIKELSLSSILICSNLANHLAAMREFRHENVNAFIGCYTTPCSFSLIYEYCSQGCLQEVINNTNITFDWDFKLSLLTDLIRACFNGMEYLHSTNLGAHGRLKSSNCVVSGRWVLKITDFGIPHIFKLAEVSPLVTIKEKLWMAPELLRDDEAAFYGTKKGDVYSFAIIMHEIVHRCMPYGPEEISADEIIQRVLTGEDPPFRPTILEEYIQPAYRKILMKCWLETPLLRPTFKELSEEIEKLTKGKKVNIVEHIFKTMETYSTQLELLVQTRTEELANEKKKKELLVTRMLPPVVAEALKAGMAVPPETYDEVSIYLSDIVGFTTISAMSTPLQVVNMLNDLYTIFDKTISNYAVYKVETIGDAYMVASGLPVRIGRRHASEVAMTALDLLSACGNFSIKHLPDVPLRLRIGLHSGPCVAGVVGLTMPRYCLFGDTVNRALKMESSGAAFRIHISQQIKEVLDEIGGYDIEYRGPIEFDGGVKTTSYWLKNCNGFNKELPEPPPLIE